MSDERGRDGGEGVLREALDRGGLEFGGSAGGEIGEKGGLGGFKGRDDEEREGSDAVGERLECWRRSRRRG